MTNVTNSKQTRQKTSPITKATHARNLALLLCLIVMMIVCYGLGMTRINGGVG